MSTQTTTSPQHATLPRLRRPPRKARFRRFTVDEYHRMIEAGILISGERVQLLEGAIIEMAAIGGEHVTSLRKSDYALSQIAPPQWHVRNQSPITLKRSEPEPDLAVVRGTLGDYVRSHPVPSAVGVAVEVSDSTLRMDRNVKSRIYARAGIPIYWIINLIDRRIEIHSDLQAGSRGRAYYRLRQIYAEGERVPVVLDGRQIGEIAVADVLP